MEIQRFIVAALAVWRITHLLQAEDGPWDVVVRLRRAVGDGVVGRAMDCFYCLSLWVAAPCAFALGQTWAERAWLCPALSGAAILLERITDRARAPAPNASLSPSTQSPEGDQDVVLRS